MKKIKLIAEIGINHNGDINLAKKLIDKSLDCGFDIVKFQKRDINQVYTKSFQIVLVRVWETLKEIRKKD